MFFSTADQIKEYVDVNAAFDYELIKPKLVQVDREVLTLYFGYDFIDELQTQYDTTTNGDISSLAAKYKKAIQLMRSISAPIATGLWVTPGQLQIDSAGIFIVRNENRATAFEWQIKNLIKSYMRAGYKAIEEAFYILDKSISDYSTFASHDEYVYYKKAFIKDSKEFTKLYSPLNNSYLSYLMLRSCMSKVEENDIRNVLLPTYYEAFKTRLAAGTLTPPDKAILPLIKQAVADLTVYKAVSELGASFDENGFMEFDNTTGNKAGDSYKTAVGATATRLVNSLETSGNSYISQLKSYLETNKADYSEYTSDSNYVADQPAVIKNDGDENFYIGM